MTVDAYFEGTDDKVRHVSVRDGDDTDYGELTERAPSASRVNRGLGDPAKVKAYSPGRGCKGPANVSRPVCPRFSIRPRSSRRSHRVGREADPAWCRSGCRKLHSQSIARRAERLDQRTAESRYHQTSRRIFRRH